MDAAELAAQREEVRKEVWEGQEANDEEINVEEIAEVENEEVVDTAPPEEVDHNAEQLSAINALSEKLEAHTFRLKQTENRLGGMNQTILDLKQTPTPEQVKKTEKYAKAKEEFKEEFPVFAASLDDERALSKTEIDHYRESVQTLEESFNKRLEDAKVEMEVSFVTSRHPEWEQTVKTPEYLAWRPTATPEIQELFASEKAVDAIKVLDAFEGSKPTKSTAQINKERENRLQENVSVKGGKATPVKAEDDMTDAEYREYARKQIFDGD